MERKEPAAALAAQFPSLPDPESGPAPNEITFTVPAYQLRPVAGWLATELQAPLVQMVGVDERPIDGMFRIYTIFHAGEQLLILRTAVTDEFPSITLTVPAAHWYEREIQEMLGLRPVGHPDPRPLVLHGGWPRDLHPLRRDFDIHSWPEPTGEPPLSFRGVSGGGVSEVPVGPIHAGIIEPGHFRFSTMGENVLRLEAQLFYTHRGLEKRAEGLSLEHGLLLAERICGACALSHATAYAQAAERLTGTAVPPRGLHLRTIALELERLYNHVGDVANLCAGAAFAFGNTQGMVLKERLMRLNEELFGHRFLRGVAAIGGVRRDVAEAVLVRTLRSLDGMESEWQELVQIILANSIFMDRVRKTGVLPQAVASALGVVGVAARASGIAADLRRDLPYAAYGSCRFQVPVYPTGDVASRLQVRLVESFESFDLVRQLVDSIPSGPVRAERVRTPSPYSRAVGYVESPRGADFHFLMAGQAGEIYRYMIRSASYPNWAAVPYAVPGNLVVDFPLINKSFELCYACLDR